MVRAHGSTSDWKDVEELLKNYAQNISLPGKIKEYARKLESKLEERRRR